MDPYPSLSKLVETMRSMRTSGPALVRPESQRFLLRSLTESGEAPRPEEVGPTLLMGHRSGNLTSHDLYHLFHQHYLQPTAAERDYKEALDHVRAPGTDNMREQCHVYAPLALRSSLPSSKFAPFKVGDQGKLTPADQSTPDLIVNFHAPSTAITLTVCHIDSANLGNLEMAVWALYSARASHPVNEVQLLRLYNQERRTLLQQVDQLSN